MHIDVIALVNFKEIFKEMKHGVGKKIEFFLFQGCR